MEKLTDPVLISHVILNSKFLEYDVRKDVENMLASGCTFYGCRSGYNNELSGVIGMNRSNLDWSVYELHSVYIRPEFQRHGNGTKLINYAISQLPKTARFVLLSTDKPDYFSKLGFKTVQCYSRPEQCLMMKDLTDDDDE